MLSRIFIDQYDVSDYSIISAGGFLRFVFANHTASYSHGSQSHLHLLRLVEKDCKHSALLILAPNRYSVEDYNVKM